MSWIALFLGLLLALAGGAGLAASIDLLTTELGVVYATCGAIGLSGGVVTIAIGLLIRRVDALRRALPREYESRTAERAEPPAPSVPPLLAGLEPVILAEPGAPEAQSAPAPAAPPPIALEPEPQPAPESAPEETLAPPSAPDDEEESAAAPINESRKGPLPALEELVHADAQAAKEPAPPPALVGRYSAGGADYSIFSDGSIEAQTSHGDFKFASMREFKAFIAAKRS